MVGRGSGGSAACRPLTRGAKFMSLRPVKRIVQSKPTIEGAGVRLRRAFGFGDTAETDPFLLLTIFATTGRAIISPVFRGIRTAELKPSLTC